jgi:hypothetical protein
MSTLHPSTPFGRSKPHSEGGCHLQRRLGVYGRAVEARGEGGAVVCAVRFVPVAGHDPKRYLVTYLAAHRDIEIWLVPLAGTRFLVPYRAAMPTPVGRGILQATRADSARIHS